MTATRTPPLSRPAEERKEDQDAGASGASSSVCHDELLFVIADLCFEMYSARELEHREKILPELEDSFGDAPPHLLHQAITVALQWKRMTEHSAKTIH